MSLTAWYNTIGSPEIQTVNQDLETIANDQNYGHYPMSDAEQLVSDAQAGLVNLPPSDVADWTDWLKDVILTGQAVEAGGYPNPEVTITSQQYSQAFAAAVAAATGSGSPSTPAAAASAPAPADTQAPADTPATQAPATQAAPAPATSAPTVASVLPVFGCYVNPPGEDEAPADSAEFGASINLVSGGTGYDSAVVKVAILDKNGNALQTQTVTASSADGNNPTWQVVIDPDGEVGSRLYRQDETSCTATVESAS